MNHAGAWRELSKKGISPARDEPRRLCKQPRESRDEDGGRAGRREAVRERTGEPGVWFADTSGSGQNDFASGLSCRSE
jgi:hypothetical protein